MSLENSNHFENKSLRQLESEKISAETKQNVQELKEDISKWIINKLNSTEGYIVRNNDILSLINKITSVWNHINFNNEWDRIWPWDIIKIENWKIFRTHNWEKVQVWVVTKGFDKITIPVKQENASLNLVANLKTTKLKPKVKKVVIPKSAHEWKKLTTQKKKKIPTQPSWKINTQHKNNETIIETVTQHYTIEIKPTWAIIPWVDNKADILVDPSYMEKDRSQLEWEAKIRYESLATVLEIWTINAQKVALNDAFLDKTKENIGKWITEVYSLLNWSLNTLFEDKNTFNDRIKKIFDVIIKVEDNERDIIDEWDMKDVKELLLWINERNYEDQMLQIYDQMRIGFAYDNWDTTVVREKIADKLLGEQKFEFIQKISSKILNTNEEITNSSIENILYWINIPEDIKEKIQIDLKLTINELQKEGIWSKANAMLKKWYDSFTEMYQINKTIFSLKDFKVFQMNQTFARIAKHQILRSYIWTFKNRWDDQTTYQWMYADIVWLWESWTFWGKTDYMSPADENIGYAEEIWATIATSLIPWWLWYVWAKWLFTLGKAWAAIQKWSKLVKWGEFLARTSAWYVGSELYRSAKEEKWQWTWTGLWEFMALDWVLSLIWKSFAKIKTKDWWKLKTRWAQWLTILWWTEAMVNIPRALEWREIVINPGNWTKEDLTLIMMFTALHWAGRYFASKNGKWNIDINRTPKPESNSNSTKMELPKNRAIEHIWKNWDNYIITTDSNWSIIRLWNVTKQRYIHWWAKTAWINNHIKNIRKQKWVKWAKNEASEVVNETTPASKIEAKYTKTITKEIAALKEKWKSISYWEYTVKVVKAPEKGLITRKVEYVVEWPNNYKWSFSKPNEAAKKIYKELSQENKLFDIAIKSWNREMQAKLKNIESKNIDTGEGIFRIRNEWSEYRVQKKNWNEYNDIKFEKLSNVQANKILETIVWSKWISSIKKIINKSSYIFSWENKKRILNKLPDGKVKKIVSEKLDYIETQLKKWGTTTQYALMWILRWNKAWETTKWNLWSSAKWRTWALSWVVANEMWDMYNNWQTWDETLSVWNWVEMVFNYAFAWHVGWLRSLVYNELMSEWSDKAVEITTGLFWKE